MRIILKPVGAMMIVGVILGLAVLALRGVGMTQASNQAVTQAADTSHFSATTPPVAALALQAPGGNTSGSIWKTEADGKIVGSGKNTMIQDFPLSATIKVPNADQGVFLARVRQLKTGTASPFPKFGIEVRGTNANESYQAWIDTKTGVLARDGYGDSSRLNWRNSPLPSDFDSAMKHEIRIEWSNSGRTWRCVVDGDEAGAQQDNFTSPILPKQFLLKTESVDAEFSEIKVL